MPKSLLPLLAVLGIGGYFFLQNFEIDGLDQLHIEPRGQQASSNGGGGGAPSFSGSATAPSMPAAGGGTTGGGAPRDGRSIRVCSFNIQVFGESKLAKPEVVDVLVNIIRRFDVVAVQEVRATSQEVLPRFRDAINADGSSFDFVLGPRLGRTNSKEQYAFLFNTNTIEVDRQATYTVQDPYDLLHREPLVASFRARGTIPERAFTFTLVNIHTDPDEVAGEVDALDDVVRAVRDDGRGEDDVMLLGDLNADEGHFGQLGQMPYITWAIRGIPTNTRGTKQYDNILFDERATIEYTGASGVLDMLREFNLSMDQALTVSDHMPIWAEFSTEEGGVGSDFARQPAGAVR